MEHIERDDSIVPFMYEYDIEAAKAAEKDGIYLDTLENRKLIEGILGQSK